MGVEKDELTIREAVAREAHILRDYTGTSDGSGFSWSTGSSFSRRSGSGRRSRHNNVRINVSGWVRDRRHSRRHRTSSWTGS